MPSKLEARLVEDLTEAMRAGDPDRKLTLRGLRAAIQNAALDEVARGKLELGGSLDEAGVMAVLQKQAKQRRDSIEQFRLGGREDLVELEARELKILESYLPRQLGEAEIEAEVRRIIAELGGDLGPSDMGKVMGPVMAAVAGLADGKRVGAIVRRVLAG
jgi:uncharacterized protein YqeY